MAPAFVYSGTSCFTREPGSIFSEIPLTIGGVYATDDNKFPCFIVSGLTDVQYGNFGVKPNIGINGSTVTPIPYSAITTGDLTLYDQDSVNGFNNIEWQFPNPFGNFYFFANNTPQIFVSSNGILNFDVDDGSCCFEQNYPGDSISPEYGQRGIFLSEYGDVISDNHGLIYSIYTGYTNSGQNYVIQLQGTYLNDFTLPFGSENLVYSYIFYNSNQNIVDLVIQYNPYGGLIRPLGGVGSPYSFNYSSTFSGTSGTAFRINANTGYDSCLSCMQGYSYGAYLIVDCITGEGYYIPMLIFDFVPIINNVYYLDIAFTSVVKRTIYKGCFSFQLANSNHYEENQLFILDLEVTTYEVSTSYGDVREEDGCTSCLTENTPIWLVKGCDGLTYYVPIIDTFGGDMITFIPFGEFDQFCGVVDGVSDAPANATYVSSLGSSRFVSCEDCQQISQKKRIIINCLDGSEEVVWGSVLFGQGDVTNLNFNNSCWQVGPETEDEVTINEFLDYEPSPTCQDCIQCNGVIYTLETCIEPFTYNVQSYSYVPFGTVIYDHQQSQCATVVDIQPGSGYSTNALYSFFSFETCEDCLSANIDTWWGQECNSGEWERIATTGSTFNDGDIVKAHYGNTDYLCYTLSGDTGGFEPTDVDYYYTPDVVPYVDCTTCQANSTIAISIITCDNKQQQYVNVSLDLYLEMSGLFNNYNYTPVILIDSTCWRILTSCPIDNNYLYINPSYRYLNCTLCSLPIEVGNETIVCFEDCSGTTYTQEVNHATWTNQFGKSITLLDSIQLGGTNGYYA
jgi:hypothetical protein